MKKFNIDEFDLKKSEIKKAIKAANSYSGFDDCTITGYYCCIETPFEFDPDEKFATVTCEICRNYKERLEFDVVLDIMLSDRRRSKATVIAR